MFDTAVETRLQTLVEAAQALPNRKFPQYSLSQAEAFLRTLQDDTRQLEAPWSPRNSRPLVVLDSTDDLLDESIELAEIDLEMIDVPPDERSGLSGADNQEVLRPHLQPPPLPIDTMAEAIGTAALRAESHRSFPPQPEVLDLAGLMAEDSEPSVLNLTTILLEDD